MTTLQAVAEYVLPSGRFARVRPVLLGDFLAAVHERGGVERFQLALLSRIVTIDGERVSIAELEAMPLEDLWPVVNHLLDELKRTAATRGVA